MHIERALARIAACPRAPGRLVLVGKYRSKSPREVGAMAADPDFRDQVLDLLAPIGEISCRSMFGGYGVFAEGDMFALIAGSALFFKVDDSNRAVYEEAG